MGQKIRGIKISPMQAGGEIGENFRLYGTISCSLNYAHAFFENHKPTTRQRLVKFKSLC